MREIIFFSTKSCTACRFLKPRVAEEFPDVVIRELTDGDAEIELYQLVSVPTILVLDTGLPIARLVGNVSMEKVKVFITEWRAVV